MLVSTPNPGVFIAPDVEFEVEVEVGIEFWNVTGIQNNRPREDRDLNRMICDGIVLFTGRLGDRAYVRLLCLLFLLVYTGFQVR